MIGFPVIRLFPASVAILVGGALIFFSWWLIRRSWYKLREGSKSLFDVFIIFIGICNIIAFTTILFLILRSLLFGIPFFE
jgi:hypothetical protein